VARVAVFGETPLRRRFANWGGRDLAYEITTPASLRGTASALRSFDAALVEGGPAARRILVALRRALPGKPVGSFSLRPSVEALRRSTELGFDFHVAMPQTPKEVLSRLEAAPIRRVARHKKARAAATASKRLAILTDIVKTANSILEPKKVIELIMARIQELIPSDAWSMLMVDEERGELTFELALGEKAKDVSGFRVKIGEGIAGWVAQTGKPTIVNDAAKDPRFSGKFDAETQFRTRSILCAPLISRGRTIGVVEIINRKGGRFTRSDLDMLLTLVDPCAIAIENAILFQRAEQLTITDDLTKLFNSRYLNLYIGREIKRCKRHGVPLSVIFLDLDGFKGVNDQYGHLAGSRTLAEVGQILVAAVRESDVLARYGGDEFVVVLPETPPAGALVIAERIRKAIEGHAFLATQGLKARISASFGVSSYPEHALTPEGLIQKADQAMYRVKERNKNGIEVAV
jgi:diguanylate cyclase (GGDEF)-like protein